MRQIAKLVGMDQSGLRRYARVTERISPREFAWLVRLTRRHGGPFTWSHLEILAQVHDVERRKRLATAAAESGLSVRALLKRRRRS